MVLISTCCSITSWIATLSCSCILSNSSIQQIPRSARTRAPPSRTNSSVTGSFCTTAVKPTPDEPRPVVYWKNVFTNSEEVNHLTSWSKSVNETKKLGFSNTRISHQNEIHISSDLHARIYEKELSNYSNWDYLLVFLFVPPISRSKSAFLTSVCPKISGAMD